MCSAVGINIKLVSTAIFGVGALLSGLGGVVACPVLSVYPGLDWEVLTLAFVVVAVGGLKSLRGSLFASLLVGVVDSFGRFLFPQIAMALIFVMLVVILIVRPTGISGEDL
jgi:branched-chain amino acid transport system permease protein